MNEVREEAIDLYKRALKHVEAGELNTAVALLTKAIARHGDVAWYHHALGEVHERQRHWPAARQAYARALQLSPVSSKYRQAMARVSAMEAAEAGVSIAPSPAGLPNNYTAQSQSAAPSTPVTQTRSTPSSTPPRESTPPGSPAADTVQEDVAVLRPTPTKPRLLVVEDSEVTRSWYDRCLRSEYQITFATNGRGALRALAQARPALVLLDWELDDPEPGPAKEGEFNDLGSVSSGLDVCTQIKRSSFRNTPVLMLTSKKGLINKTRSKLARADRFLTKPVTAEILQTAIRELLADPNLGAVGQLATDSDLDGQ